jgi:hypothetical protein
MEELAKILSTSFLFSSAKIFSTEPRALFIATSSGSSARYLSEGLGALEESASSYGGRA